MIRWGGLLCLILIYVTFGTTHIISWPFFDQQTSKGDRITLTLDSKQVHVIFDSMTGYDYGDKVRITGKITTCKPPTNPGQFNFCRWQYRNGIDASMFVSSHKLVSKSQKRNILIGISKLSDALYNQCVRLFKHHPGMIYTMIFGARQDFIPEDTTTNVSNVGLIHLLVVSGSQIGLITGIAMAVFYRLFRWSFLISFICVFIFQSIYLFIAGIDPSILRSVIMTNLLIWNHFYLLRRYPFWWYLAIAASIVILINPKCILMPGFWYSFLITLGLIQLTPPLMSKIKGPRLLIGYISANIIATSIAVPIQLIQSSIIMPISIVSNIWVSWMSTVILVGGLISMFVSMVSLPLGQCIGKGIDFIADVMIKLSDILSEMGPIVSFDKVSIICLFLTFSITLVMIIAYQQRWARLRTCFLAYLLMVIIINLSGILYLKQRQFILALDVGQGDATLIISGFNSILIDCGGFKGEIPIAKNSIIPTLRYYGIDQLDALIITHHDADHVGGLESILSFGVKDIFSNEEMPLINHHHIVDETQLNIFNGNIHLFPTSKVAPYESSNNRSLLIHVRLNGVLFLITGDIDQWMELRLLSYNLISDVDVLKLGHHGSRYSTSNELLMKTSPMITWNSSGQYNRYGHPHQDTLNRIKKKDIHLFSTHNDGAIQFLIRSFGIIVKSNQIQTNFYINYPTKKHISQ